MLLLLLLLLMVMMVVVICPFPVLERYSKNLL
jgi:hypothetical protein